MSENEKTEFILPQHNPAEECYDEYEEEIDPSGKYVRHDVDPTISQMAVPGYASETGKNFSLDLTKQVKVNTFFNEQGRKMVHMRATKSAWIHNLIFLNGKKFDFGGREYLRQIYDHPCKEIILKTGRQVEKCCPASTLFLMENGSEKPLYSLNVGDMVVSYDERGKAVTGRVSRIEPNGVKPLIKITTRKKRSLKTTFNHPYKQLLKWTDAENLKVGDFVALPHKAGIFGSVHDPDWAYMLGLLIGDGCLLYDSKFGFTQNKGPTRDKFLQLVEVLKDRILHFKEENFFPLSRDGVIARKLKALGLFDLNSFEKHFPEEFFNYDQESTANLLRGLWATDGHLKDVHKSKRDLVYCSVSENLIKGVQKLLLKFGIFSSYRENTPTLYKGTDKKAFILRVTGRRSFERFKGSLYPIPGKDFTIPVCNENSNSHKIPIDVQELILKIYESGTNKASKLLKKNLRKTLRYSPSFNKVKDYISFFEGEGCYDQDSINQLKTLLDEDLFWDEVSTIEVLEPEETFSVEVEKYHNFVTDGIVTHNSTMLANNLSVMCSIMPFFKCLYVSPSHVQTRTFSNDKLKPVIERSPLIQRYLQDSSVSNQVFEKGFTNGSFIFLRSAFLSADRARGISSDLLCLDELQDLILSNIPVIAQCLSHSKYGYHIYAGTPKTFDNSIEIIWDSSSQNEWMVACRSCSGATGKKWNFLDIKNIGKTGPICKYCGAPLDVTNGQWQMAKESRMQGFRIPQIMVPWIAGNPNQWGKLVHDMETYPESQFYNEVLGLSYDSASKPITRADVMLNCNTKRVMVRDPFMMNEMEKNMIRKGALFAGVDWGEGNDGTGTDIMGKIKTASYTVLTIGGFIGQKFRVVFSKRYKGKEIDPDYVVDDVVKICNIMGVKMIGVDWGHGWGVNNRLFRMYGPKRCVQFMYVDRQKEVRKWDPVGYKFQLQRNHVMSELFYMFKEQKFDMPPLETWEEYAKDMFNISIEYIEYQRKLRYVHRPSDPDDWFHSLNYCVQVAKVYHGKR